MEAGLQMIDNSFKNVFWIFLSLTSPFLPASLSRANITATLWPIGVSSGISTDKSEVMSNSGLLSFSSRMVIDTCQKNSVMKNHAKNYFSGRILTFVALKWSDE